MRPLPAFTLALLAIVAQPACQDSTPTPRPGTMTISFLDVGQGDAILIRSPEGKTALIDAGPSAHRVVSLLKDRGVTSIDLLAISHHHADHYGGAAAVVEAFPPRAFLASDSSHATPHYLKLLEKIRDLNVRTIFPTDAPRRIELGSVVLTVLPREPEDPAEENNNSIGIRLDYGEFSALLPGDAEAAERSRWLRDAPDLCADCTVLKLAHHGSRNGTDFDWLEAVRPRLAIASVGLDNEFHHPHPSTVALLEREGIPLLRTDRAGTITVTTDGRRWRVSEDRPTGRAPPEAHARGADPDAGPVDLNRANEDQLRTLPGIGRVLAGRIIEGRPYASIDDLSRVTGIGPKHIDRLRGRVVVGP